MNRLEPVVLVFIYLIASVERLSILPFIVFVPATGYQVGIGRQHAVTQLLLDGFVIFPILLIAVNHLLCTIDHIGCHETILALRTKEHILCRHDSGIAILLMGCNQWVFTDGVGNNLTYLFIIISTEISIIVINSIGFLVGVVGVTVNLRDIVGSHDAYMVWVVIIAIQVPSIARTLTGGLGEVDVTAFFAIDIETTIAVAIGIEGFLHLCHDTVITVFLIETLTIEIL